MTDAGVPARTTAMRLPRRARSALNGAVMSERFVAIATSVLFAANPLLLTACESEDLELDDRDGGVERDGGVVRDGGPDDAIPFETCPLGGSSIEGTIDGESIALSAEGAGWIRTTALAPTSIVGFLGAQGQLYASTSTVFVDTMAPGRGVLFLPAHAADPGRALCAGAGSWVRSTEDPMSGDSRAHLEALAPIGACADASATSDRLSACIGHGGNDCPLADGSRADSVFSGVVRGAAFEQPQAPVVVVVAEQTGGVVTAMFAGGRAYAELVPEGDHYVGSLIWRDDPSGAPPIVYCVERAQADLGNDATILEFEALRVRGDCAVATGVPGTLDVCW